MGKLSLKEIMDVRSTESAKGCVSIPAQCPGQFTKPVHICGSPSFHLLETAVEI